MRKANWLIAGAACVASVAVFAADDNNAMKQAQDRADIEALMWRYVQIGRAHV